MRQNPSTPTNPELLTASDMVAAFKSRVLSPVEVAKAALDRIATLNPKINAFYSIDHDGALAAALESEKRWIKSCPIGAFDGVPTSIKDSLQSTGEISAFGSATIKGALKASNNDAPSVARLKESGAVILGRTTMCDFGLLPSGYSTAFGPARNPWNTAYTTGGSSAGAAGSIAAGINPVAVGTDIVGSIRLPASYCGLVGHKPSYGRVPYFFQNSPAVVSGPMGRTVGDVASLLTLISRPDDRDFTSLPYDPVDYAASLEMKPAVRTLGLLLEMGFGPKADAEVLAIVETRARELANALHAQIVDLKPPFKPEDLASAEDFYRIRCLTQFEQFDAEKQARSEVIFNWVNPARGMSAADGYRRFDSLQVIRHRVVRLISKCDYLILPSVAIPPTSAEQPGLDPQNFFADWSNTFVFNLTEQPCISVPAGLTREGLPVGLQIVGSRFNDLGVLQIARVAEKTWGPFPASPMVESSTTAPSTNFMYYF
jgi:aspartyl-tRNA(Asn)/glutamyl-tRNA(Gln) amidotransferase subunit A